MKTINQFIAQGHTNAAAFVNTQRNKNRLFPANVSY